MTRKKKYKRIRRVRKTPKKAPRKEEKPTINMKEKVKRILKPTSEKLVWLIIGALLSPIIAAYIRPIVLPILHPEKPELKIDVFQSHAPYKNGTNVHGIIWNSFYAEYIIMIQCDMSKAKSTPIEDIYLVFDFDAAILTAYEDRIEGVTNPSIRIGGGVTIVGDGEIIADIKYCELIVDLEKLKPGGLCALAVIINPKYEGSLARLHIVPNPTSRYFGSYRYDAWGVMVKKSVSGDIPSPR